MCLEAGNPRFTNPGQCQIRVVRGSNTHRVQMRLVSGCHAAGPWMTAELEAGITFPLAAQCVYNLFLSIARKDVGAGPAAADVTITANGNILVDRTCQSQGQPISGEWVIVCP